MKLAVSLGDPNGIGPQLLLETHAEVARLCEPVYCCDERVLQECAERLGVEIPNDIRLADGGGECSLHPGQVHPEAGEYSFRSFRKAVEMCQEGEVSGMVTLPISKEAWGMAGIPYRGHTEALRDFFRQEAIMLMGCPEMYVALFTEHIPLNEVCARIKADELERFLVKLVGDFSAEKVAVLGINPHGGDGGVLGCEDGDVALAIREANARVGEELFFGPFVPDTAFTPAMREKFSLYVAMYHDQGLIPLKTLYFDESVNISLGLPIVRTSVDHGTAFDIAYQRKKVSSKSYLNAVRAALELVKKRGSKDE